MITNERQYRIAKAQWSRFKEAIDDFDLRAAAERIGSRALAKAELDALKSEEEILAAQISEYEHLKSGAVTVLRAESIEELPRLLIKARIARRLSQRELAEMLGINEQQIQRYEAEGYASASLRRLAEVANSLELDINETAELRQSAVRERPDEGR